MQCLKCNHVWEPYRNKIPKSCPSCRSYNYNKPRKYQVLPKSKNIIQDIKSEIKPETKTEIKKEEEKKDTETKSVLDFD